MQPKPTISVCTSTYNEEKNISRCLESVIDWVDEVIVVDGTSIDQTVTKVKSFGKKVKAIVTNNPPNFLINRQKALDQAKSLWILQLDADEVVSSELKAEVEKIVNNPNLDSKVAYWVPRANYFLGGYLKKGGVYPDYCLRLYLNKLAKMPLESIHDQVQINLGKAQTLYSIKKPELGFLKHDLWHYPYPNFQTYLRKWIQYSDHEADLLIKQKVKISFTFWLNYFIIKPFFWFIKTYFRHKGFMDQFPGFVFSLFSSLRFWAIYIKLYEKIKSR